MLELYTEEKYLETVFDDGEPLLEGLLYKGQNILFVAPKKSAKTMFTMQMALCVAHGKPFLGRWPSPRPHKVLYLVFENSDAELQSMIRRQRNGLAIEDYTEQFVLGKMPYLHVGDDAGEAQLDAILTEVKPDLLVLDPLYRVHKGTVNDDGLMNETTGRLTELTMKHGHATWMLHHEHRTRYEQGLAYEATKDKYAGSWVLGAWASAAYGFEFFRQKKAATFASHYERTPRLDGDVKLQLVDEPDTLLFMMGLEEQLLSSLPSLQGVGISEAARRFDVHHEKMRRALITLQKQGALILMPGGPGKDTIIGLPLVEAE